MFRPWVTPTTTARRKPHPFVDDPAAPGTCKTCFLTDDVQNPHNRIHSEESIADMERELDERQAQSLRQTGDRADDRG